jgi:hypothetical protein
MPSLILLATLISVVFGYNRALLPTDYTSTGALLIHSGDTIRMQGNCYVAYDRYTVTGLHYLDQYVRWHISGTDSSTDAGVGSGFVAANSGCPDHPQPNYNDSNTNVDTLIKYNSLALAQSPKVWTLVNLGIGLMLFAFAGKTAVALVLRLVNNSSGNSEL